MNILDSFLYLADLKKSATFVSSLSKSLYGKTFLVTGCNGLICSALVDLLISMNAVYDLNLKILLATRNINVTKNRFMLSKYSFAIPVLYDATKQFDIDEKVDFIIHGASNAFPRAIGEHPVETLQANLFGTEELIKLAKKNGARFLYISSSEVYGFLDGQKAPIKENQYGFIDILNPRSSYSVGKRAAESLCASYRAEYGIDFVVARPGHIYGPTASMNDNRVSSQFMFDAAFGRNLVLKSKGDQVRSYCYCLDCAMAILTILLLGKSGEAYNISNSSSICSIREMAHFFAKAANVEVIFDLPTEAERLNFNPMLNSSLDSSRLESLGFKPLFSVEEGFFHSISIIKEVYESNHGH